MENMIGYVTGIEETGTTQFFVNLSEPKAKMVQENDIVKTSFSYDNYGEITLYGIVAENTSKWDNISAGYEERQKLSIGYDSRELIRYRIRIEITRSILTMKNGEKSDKAPYVPPVIGTAVYLLDEQTEVNIALGQDKIIKKNRAIPFGILRNGCVCYLDLDFITGENGAHINMSGQSGVAAKTSTLSFLQYSIRETAKKKAKEGMSEFNNVANGRYIIFNVKGEGLMFVDEMNSDFTKGEKRKQWEEDYEKMDLPTIPFDNCKFYAPISKNTGKPDVNHRTYDVNYFGWDVIDLIELGLMTLLFDPGELSRNVNIQLAVSAIEDYMEESAGKIYDEIIKEIKRFDNHLKNKIKIKDTSNLTRGQLLRIYLSVCKNSSDTNYEFDDKYYFDSLEKEEFLPNSLKKLIELLKSPFVVNKLQSEEDLEEKTVKATIRRIKAAYKMDIDRMVRQYKDYNNIAQEYKKPEYHIDWDRPGITVIDISKLRERAQIFAVGAVLKEILLKKESGMTKEPVFIFIDELNKYAPRESGGALGAVFRDISERGRSFGIILMGAEQTASLVDYRVVTQNATTIVGRQKYSELDKPEYSHLNKELKDRAANLLPGECIVEQPHLRRPLIVSTPMPVWATKESAHESKNKNKKFGDY